MPQSKRKNGSAAYSKRHFAVFSIAKHSRFRIFLSVCRILLGQRFFRNGKSQIAAERDVLIGMLFVIGVDDIFFNGGKGAKLDKQTAKPRKYTTIDDSGEKQHERV